MVNTSKGAWFVSTLFFIFMIQAIWYGFYDLGTVISSNDFEVQYVPWTRRKEDYCQDWKERLPYMNEKAWGCDNYTLENDKEFSEYHDWQNII